MSRWMYVLGMVLIAGFAVMMAFEMKSAATPYVTKVDEVVQSPGRTIQFKGAIVHDGATYDRGSHELRFTLRDDSGKTLEARYGGPKPGNFDTADTAVVRGVYRGSSLMADQLSLKCPSKYEGQK